jgi:pilus assembly protein TadC
VDAVVLFRSFFETLFGKKGIKVFENTLFMNNSFKNRIEVFILFCVIEGIAFLIGTMIFLFYLKINFDKLFFISALLFFVPFFLNYLWQDIKFERRKRKKEELLPELLLEASVFYDNNSFIHNLERFKEIDLGILREEFERIVREIKNGSEIREALERAKKLNKSMSFDRVIDLLLHGYESGIELSDLLKETAEDLLENKAILRERQAVMLVTKYTLLLSSALIVPSILGLIIGLVNGLNFSLMSELAIGLSLEERKEIFSFAVMGAGIYIFEFSFLSSFFLGLQEGNKKQAWVYILLICPIALICFFIAQNFF